MTRKACAICGKYITENFHVCMDCVKRFNIPYKYRNWPRWLKDLVNMDAIQLRIDREECYYESFEDVQDYEVIKRLP